jgi:phosphopantetheine--protein transferase-like protein
MPFAEKITTKTGVLGIWKLKETAADLISQFQFSDNELENFTKIKHETRKREYLATRLLLQKLLNKKVEIEYLQSGKPLLKNSHFNISISHSANFVAIIISTKKIGIDIENTNRNITKIATKFLSSDEIEHIKKTENKQIATTLYWSAKEAIFKCTNENGIQINEQIAILPFEIKKEGKFAGIFNKETHYKLWYLFYENNIIVYCVEQQNTLV